MACLAVATPRAHANDAVAAAPTLQPPAQQNANGDDAAAVAFKRALQQHAAGDLKGARTSMLESYRLSKRAELLYNIARIQSALGECALALAAYRDYLKQVPDGRYRVEAQQATAELEAQCPSAEASAAAAAPPAASTMLAAPPPGPTASASDAQQQSGTTSADAAPAKQDTATPVSNRAATVRWIGWSAIAAGALAGGGSVYFTVKAYDAHDRFAENVKRASRNEAAFDKSIQDEQHSHQRWAKILGVTGGVLLVGGTLTLLFGPRDPLPAGTRVGLQVLPGSLGASYAATF